MENKNREKNNSDGYVQQETATDLPLLARATECMESLRGFRRDRERCKRFTYGDQWNDMIEDHGVMMRESDYIVSQGNMPLKNNLIRRLVRNVLGVYRNQWHTPVCRPRDLRDTEEAEEINRILRETLEGNRLEEMYARTMEEFLISGVAIHKKWYGRRGRQTGCQTDQVSPSQFFFDTTSRDFRGGDMTLIGEIHTMRLDDMLSQFTRNPEETERLCRLYGAKAAGDENLTCTVYEVWERRSPLRLCCTDRRDGRVYTLPEESEREIREENSRRTRVGYTRLIETNWKRSEEWRYTFMTPDGKVIRSGWSPYAHHSHPYVFKAYPYIDGEIHSFVSDIIDQQKLTNRLISMYDWILRASAKGVLLFPEGALPEGVDINDVADEWSRFNGVIVYRPRAGVPLPQQVSSNSTDIGITELLEIQMKMMEDISGVNGALQGKLDSNSMSGTLYNQQTQNSLTALADLLKSFNDFVTEATAKEISNIRQFYFCE